MIISDSITIGQLTFILRVAIQILTHAGIALIGVIILGNTPRVAPIDTHDLMNRVVGASSATLSSFQWIITRLRGKAKDPVPPTNLLIALLLSISYAAFVALSDIGFLGFYACSVPGPSILDVPASASSFDTAQALVFANMVNGTDPSVVKAYRCDSTELLQFQSNITESSCTSWRNSTYADPTLFNGINSTDTDVLMPRQLTHHDFATEIIDLNSYYIGPNTQRVMVPTLRKGIAVEPHETGLRVVLGVPQLASLHKVELAKTMALEVDVGCMTLGIYTMHQVDTLGLGLDLFATHDTWREYVGPDYLRPVLANTTDVIREYARPLFNTSSLTDDGFLFGINSTSLVLSSAAHVRQYRLPKQGFDLGPDSQILDDCSKALQTQLGIQSTSDRTPGRMCGLLGMGGSRGTNGTMSQRFTRMVCATATQINMVRATVTVDEENNVSLNVTRLPSDLNYVRAEYWDQQTTGNDTTFVNFVPYERYTLSDNPASPSSHHIFHAKHLMSDNTLGPGSGGTPFSRIGDMMLGGDGIFDKAEFSGLGLLEEGFDEVKLNTSRVTTWAAQVGGSFVYASIGYNGWAAQGSSRIEVLSTGGHAGSCYKPHYALGFFPLVFSATVVLCWAFIMLFGSSLFGSKVLRESYGGISPYTGVVCPGAPKDTLLVWEKTPGVRLQVIEKGHPITGTSGTALKYFKSSYSYP